MTYTEKKKKNRKKDKEERRRSKQEARQKKNDILLQNESQNGTSSRATFTRSRCNRANIRKVWCILKTVVGSEIWKGNQTSSVLLPLL
jgi:hypothetical protein